MSSSVYGRQCALAGFLAANIKKRRSSWVYRQKSKSFDTVWGKLKNYGRHRSAGWCGERRRAVSIPARLGVTPAETKRVLLWVICWSVTMLLSLPGLFKAIMANAAVTKLGCCRFGGGVRSFFGPEPLGAD